MKRRYVISFITFICALVVGLSYAKRDQASPSDSHQREPSPHDVGVQSRGGAIRGKPHDSHTNKPRSLPQLCTDSQIFSRFFVLKDYLAAKSLDGILWLKKDDLSFHCAESPQGAYNHWINTDDLLITTGGTNDPFVKIWEPGASAPLFNIELFDGFGTIYQTCIDQDILWVSGQRGRVVPGVSCGVKPPGQMVKVNIRTGLFEYVHIYDGIGLVMDLICGPGWVAGNDINYLEKNYYWIKRHERVDIVKVPYDYPYILSTNASEIKFEAPKPDTAIASRLSYFRTYDIDAMTWSDVQIEPFIWDTVRASHFICYEYGDGSTNTSLDCDFTNFHIDFEDKESYSRYQPFEISRRDSFYQSRGFDRAYWDPELPHAIILTWLGQVVDWRDVRTGALIKRVQIPGDHRYPTIPSPLFPTQDKDNP